MSELLSVDYAAQQSVQQSVEQSAQPSDGYTLQRRQAPGEFARLRELMIHAVQQLAGQQWTDYNLHDPGVTILEQLSYALTDINHRTGYDIEALLADQNHALELARHGMAVPEQALCCRPVTRLDQMKALLDAVPELARVQLEATCLPLEPSHETVLLPWLLSIRVFSREKPANVQQARQRVAQVRAAFHRMRNLGEDLYTVTLADEKAVMLSGCLFVQPSVVESGTETELLARAYLAAQAYLLGDSLDATAAVDTWNGPETKRLAVADAALAEAAEPRSLAGLIDALGRVAGVIEVDRIALFGLENGKPVALDLADCAHKNQLIRLQLPQEPGATALSLACNHRSLSYEFFQLQEQYQSLQEARQLTLHTATVTSTPAVKSVARKDLASYVSVMEHFPQNYGVGQFGISQKEAPERRAQVRQLQGYLSLFDQLLIDHLAMLDNVKHFFSTDLQQPYSYPSGGQRTATGAPREGLWLRQTPRNFLAAIDAYDNYPQRKLRVFDFMCAMNGRERETFGWEFRNPYLSESEKQARLLREKQRYLRALSSLDKNRAAAFNYTAPSWGRPNLATLESRIRLLLGLDSRRLSTVYPLVKRGLSHSNDNLGFHFNANSGNAEQALASAFYRHIGHATAHQHAENFVPVPALNIDEKAAWHTFDAVRNHAFGNLKNLRQLLFQAGAKLDSYRLGQVASKRELELYIDLGQGVDENWLYLMSFRRKHTAVRVANELRFCMERLNLEMEGLHVLEHALLLPVDDDHRTALLGVDDVSFFANRLTVVLPCWTARFVDQDFQHYVESLLLQEIPAHLYARIFWLDYADMEKFEVLFKNWCDQKRKADSSRRLNALSGRLYQFLQHLEQRAA